MRRFAPRLFAQLSCLVLVLFLTSLSHSQAPLKPRTSRQEIQNQDWTPGEIQSQVSPQYEVLAQLSLREDFRRLQVVNVQLLKRMIGRSEKTNDHKKIKSDLAEIRKLAMRLRTRLAIPEIESEENSCNYDVELVPGVLLLDKAITSFVENPLFQQPNVIDKEMALQAGEDMNEIVGLTDFLRTLLNQD